MVGGASCCLCGAFVSSLSGHISPEQSWSPTGWPTVMALIRSSGKFWLQHGCSGEASSLGVDAGLIAQSTLIAIILKVGTLRLASALVSRRFTVMGTSVFEVGAGVGASRGLLAIKRA